MEITALTAKHPDWDAVIHFAENCSWRGGKYLAEQMRENRFQERERVFVARHEKQIAGYCTLTKKDELPEAYDYTPFIGSIFVGETFRGNRLSEKLIQAAAAYAAQLGFSAVYIMSGETGLYEKYGFSLLGSYPTVFGTEEQLFVRSTGSGLHRMLGRTVTVTTDRPLGSYHPEYPDMYYPVNYGYIKGITAPDGEEQDAYILGVDRPVAEFTGRVIAVVRRADDVEEKWVVCPEDMFFDKAEIAAQIRFQEQYFHSEIIM